MSTPALPDLSNLNLKLNVTGTLPGETIIAALINYAAAREATMDPALKARLDAVLVQQVEDLQHVWRGIWHAWGIV